VGSFSLLCAFSIPEEVAKNKAGWDGELVRRIILTFHYSENYPKNKQTCSSSVYIVALN